jgi:hypothetical protein
MTAVALYTVLGQWSLSVGNDHFRHLVKQKPLDRLKQTFVELIPSVGPQNRRTFIMIGEVTAPIWMKWSTGGVFYWQVK